MSESKRTKGHGSWDRETKIKVASIVGCGAAMVVIALGANSERTRFLTHTHEMSEPIVVMEPCCMVPGDAYTECQYPECTYTETVEVPALDHVVEGLVCTRCEQAFEPYFEVVEGQYQVFVYGKAYDGYTGLVSYQEEKLYARDGIHDPEYEGLYHTEDKVYYIVDGKLQSDYNDYLYAENRKWYVKDGIAYTYYNGPVSFTWPAPSSHLISSYFGPRSQPTAGASTNHKGVDIAAMHGTTIVAAASGTVVEAGYNDVRGNYMMIKHGDGLKTAYLHCSQVDVSVGEEVDMGEAIGKVGSTGVSTGAHLHFSVYLDGTPVNPLFYTN